MENAALSCSLCEELFESESALRRHQQTVHAAEMSNRRRLHDNQYESEEDDQETAA